MISCSFGDAAFPIFIHKAPADLQQEIFEDSMLSDPPSSDWKLLENMQTEHLCRRRQNYYPSGMQTQAPVGKL